MNCLQVLKYEILVSYTGFKCILEDFFKSSSNIRDLPRRKGDVVVMTGGLRGIGLEVIRMLLECDMIVVVGCRDIEKGEHFANKMRMEGTTLGKLDFKTLDVSSMESVRNFAAAVKKDYPKIHVLINNAAVMYVPYAITSEGYETQFATNYLGHFLLTHLLLKQLDATGTEDAPARVVHISSVAHELGGINFDDINFEKEYYIAYKAYSQSKLAQLLFGLYLNEILKERKSNVRSYVVHPGIVNTELFNNTIVKKTSPFILGLWFKPPDKGAVPIVFCAISPQAKHLDGCYVSNCLKKETPVTKNSKDLQQKLFNFSTDLLKIEEFGKS
ncbi:short chain dehydrogenase [Popillia japonica]|uniref:Short chain dehydrogenase n=1 Tax=Popillia japonica TaxID=7064 RepID=A0AAW1K2Q1_POPJA